MGLILTLEPLVSMKKPGAGTESDAAGMRPYQVRASSPRTLSLKVLLALTAAVLLAHLVMLRVPLVADLNREPVELAPNRPFTTRAVALETTRSSSAKPPVIPAAAAPRPSQKSPPIQDRKLIPPPAARPMPSAATTDPTPTVEPQAPDPPGAEPPGPVENPAPEPAPEVDPLASAPPPPRTPDPLGTDFTLPPSVRLQYQVTANKFPFSLNSELRWQQDGENFEARLEFSAFGQSRVQTSRGQITAQGLAPLRFSDKYRSEVAAHFERDKGKVTFSANTPDAPLLAGAQDRLSILVQLAAIMAGAPEQYPSATTLTIQTIGPRDADTWLFTVGNPETLTLPGGDLATLKLLRNPRQPFDQKVELWLAPALGYLPARLRITEANGDYMDQQWRATVAPP